MARVGILCPGEEENFEEKLDNHELRLELGDGDPPLGILPFNVVVFSVEELLEKPGLCAAIGLGGVEAVVSDGSGGSVPWPFCPGGDFVSGGELGPLEGLRESIY